nr:hypothetical protein [Streptomyces graminofaciens]
MLTTIASFFAASSLPSYSRAAPEPYPPPWIQTSTGNRFPAMWAGR